MDRIEDTAVFIQVADLGSFSAAARRLNRSPAAITRAVADLEARLGVRLLNRTTRAVSLTDAGQRYLTGARRVLADLEEVEQVAAGEGASPRGELSVTAPVVFGRLHVLPLVTQFLTQYPAVNVRLALIDRPVDLVDDALDAAIRIGELRASSAIATRVGTVRRMAVAAPAYLERRGMPRAPEDLAAHDIVAFSGIDGVERWRFRSRGRDFDHAVGPRLIVNTAEAAIDAVTAGFGVTRVLSYQIAHALSEKSLIRVLRSYEVEAVPIHILYPHGKFLAPKLRAFLDFVVPRLRQRCAEIAKIG